MLLKSAYDLANMSNFPSQANPLTFPVINNDPGVQLELQTRLKTHAFFMHDAESIYLVMAWSRYGTVVKAGPLWLE